MIKESDLNKMGLDQRKMTGKNQVGSGNGPLFIGKEKIAVTGGRHH
jgi:hypothetical protein